MKINGESNAPHLQLRDIWHRYADRNGNGVSVGKRSGNSTAKRGKGTGGSGGSGVGGDGDGAGAGGGGWTLRQLDLTLQRGELVGLLGPSGCGKTTLLRLVAGFERPQRGSVWLGGRQVAGPQQWLPAERRGVGMVFQDYALFPHLDAWQNACFGLRRGQDHSRVHWLLELLGLEGLERRYPHQLSGGQRQRLALARALAPQPEVVLLDEPFSNLDVEVRLRLRSELPRVLGSVGASGLIVTHDPEEALAICDRVAVLRDGVMHQIAPPRQLVQQPATAFVGRFVLQANLLPARLEAGQLVTPLGLIPAGQWRRADEKKQGEAEHRAGQGLVTEPLAAGSFAAGSLAAGSLAAEPLAAGSFAAEPLAAGSLAAESLVREPLQVMLGQEDLQLESDHQGEWQLVGREFLGSTWLALLECRGQRLRLKLPLDHPCELGMGCRVTVRHQAVATLFGGGEVGDLHGGVVDRGGVISEDSAAVGV